MVYDIPHIPSFSEYSLKISTVISANHMSLTKTIRLYLSSFTNLIFPNLCVACNVALSGNEQFVCSKCLSSLPFTNFWEHKNNPVEEVFWGRVHLENAASMVFFEKGSAFQKILHQLKYRNNPDIGIHIGKYFGNKLLNTAYCNIDIIIPVPLHRSRFKKRGYNQSEKIAEGLGFVFKKPAVNQVIKRSKATKTQTSKSRFERWQNVEGVFDVVDKSILVNKHILVVDDVITTGATSESLITEILKIPGTKVSFVALASA